METFNSTLQDSAILLNVTIYNLLQDSAILMNTTICNQSTALKQVRTQEQHKHNHVVLIMS